MKMGQTAALLVLLLLATLACGSAAGAPPGWAAPALNAEGVPGGPGLLADATLAFVSPNVLVGLGQTATVRVELQSVSNLYGYQYQVAYDPSRVSAAAVFVNSFFDTSSGASVPAGWDASCGAGVCRFAATKVSPAAPVSGSGALAEITFTGISAGSAPLSFNSDFLSDRNGFAIAHSATAGLVSVCSGPTSLSLLPVASKLGVGMTTTIDLRLACVYDLYGYQVQVSYDGGKLAAAGAFDNSFFDTTVDASVPGGWNAACSGGACRFAATRLLPADPLTGTGSIANITFTAQHAGIVPLTFGVNYLSNADGFPIVHSTTTATITIYGYATITGTVQLQGRTTPISSGTVAFTETTHTYPPAVVGFNASTGVYSVTLPVDPGGMAYDVTARHLLYLNNVYPAFVVQPEQVYLLATTTLRAGDANNDGTVSILDLSCVGGDFDHIPARSTCGGTGSTDINEDGAVNIFDLVLVGSNYDRSSPQPW